MEVTSDLYDALAALYTHDGKMAVVLLKISMCFNRQIICFESGCAFVNYWSTRKWRRRFFWPQPCKQLFLWNVALKLTIVLHPHTQLLRKWRWCCSIRWTYRCPPSPRLIMQRNCKLLLSVHVKLHAQMLVNNTFKFYL